jgi:hypothetical protein
MWHGLMVFYGTALLDVWKNLSFHIFLLIAKMLELSTDSKINSASKIQLLHSGSF